MSVNASDWNDEWRSANYAMTELERAHLQYAPNGGMIVGEKEDARGD